MAQNVISLRRRRVCRILSQCFLIFVLALITVAVLYPLLFVVITSFKNYGQVLADPFGISFDHPENYINAWIQGNFGAYFLNSIIVVVCGVAAQVFFTAIISFAIGVLRYKGSSVVMFALMSTMFLTGEIISIPLYVLFYNLGLLRSLWAIILPAMFGAPGMGALLASNYIRKIPNELHEASLLDGANFLQMFFRIDLPMMRPILTFVAIQVFTGTWSDFFWPFITVYGNPSAYTLPLGLIAFQSQNSAQFGVLSAGLCIITLPIVIFYCFFSKYFLEGAAAGAVKG